MDSHGGLRLGIIVDVLVTLSVSGRRNLGIGNAGWIGGGKRAGVRGDERGAAIAERAIGARRVSLRCLRGRGTGVVQHGEQLLRCGDGAMRVPAAWRRARFAFGALVRAPRLGMVSVWALALLASIGHAEERADKPVESGVFYVSATVLSDGAGGLSGRGTAVAFASAECEWDDAPPGATVACVSPVAEGARQRIVVRHVNAAGEPVEAETDTEFQYRTIPISATAGSDYLSASGTVTIEEGELLSSPATFTTLDDVIDEFRESFVVELKTDSSIDLEFDHVVIPIEDNDPEVRVSLEGEEGSEDAGALSFEVSLTGASGKTVSVDFATSDGTATADADYRPASGTLTFEPGEVTKTVEVSVIDDAINESAEWFALALSNARNASLPRFPARGTIQDDDAVLTITGAKATEVSGKLEFVVTIAGMRAGSAPATVEYSTVAGTATAGADFEPVAGTLSFTADRVTQAVAVPLVDDAVDEPDETLAVVLTNAENAAIGTATAIGLIEDDDPVPELEISGGSAGEGETLGFVVTLSGSTARTVTVDYATTEGSATAGADYAPVSGSLTFEPGESSAAIRVEIVDDETYEPDETFFARLSSPVNAVIAIGEATGTVFDDDEQPAVVTVRPQNPMLCVGGAPVRIDLSQHFAGTGLRYAVSEPDPGVATASLEGAVLTLTPVEEGATSVTVTAANTSSEARFELAITVVADPAELAAIERGLAVTGGAILADAIDAIGDRFAGADASDRGSNPPRTPSTLGVLNATSAFATDWGVNPSGIGAQAVSEAWPAVRPFDDMPLASGSLTFSANPRSGIENWSLWGRGSTRRFDSGELFGDGSLSALQLGLDARVGDWLVGAAAGLARTDVEYGFMRSVDACGGGGEGEGLLETEIASVHPYLGRRVGSGWIWGTAGMGGGEAVVERCASGHRTTADLSMRMGALGGRHLVRSSERIEVSIVEDVGMLRAETEAAVGTAGDHDVSVGRARLGLEVSGVRATGAGIVGWIRAFARSDWGDGIEGSGAELALGARLLAPDARLRIEAAVHAVAAHTEDDYREAGANMAAAYLPRADGTGLQASMTLRRGAQGSTPGLDGSSRLSPGQRVAPHALRGDVFVGFGFRAPRGLVQPFATLEKSDRGSRLAAGLRYEAVGVQPRFVGEFSIGHRQGFVDGSYVMARFESRR